MSIVGLRRPSAADVTPGSELYEKIIRALRGEWTSTSDSSRAERRTGSTAGKESVNKVVNTSVTELPFPAPFNAEDLPSIETPPTTPPLKRPCYLENTVETATVGRYEEFEVVNDPLSAINNATAAISTNSTIMEQNVVAINTIATSTLTRPTPVSLETQPVQSAVAEKLQKISQIDKTCSTKLKPQSKYKPPYKIEKSHIPDLSTKNLKQTEICCDPSSGKMTYRLHHPSDNQTSDAQQCDTQASELQRIAAMSEEKLTGLELLLEQAVEVACSLYFSAGTWQLREADVTKVSKRSELADIDGICISTTLKKENDLITKHLLVPLDSSQPTLHSWSRRILGKIMSNEKCHKVCYGAQEIVEVLYTHFNLSAKDCLHWKLLDIQVGCWLLDSDHPPHSYADCCKLLSIDHPTVEGDVDKEHLFCTDMLTLISAMSTLSDRLRSNELWQLYYELEVRIIPLLAIMQNTGIHVDTSKLLEYSDLIKTRMTMIETEAHKMAGHSFLLSSTHQLRQVLFDELALHKKCQRSLSKTASQKFTSTSEHVLVQLQDVHPLPGLILEYRHFAKTKSTYIDGILPYISDECQLFYNSLGDPEAILGRVHTGTATGRLVSINPNIQAFPKQPINLGVVKKSFVAGRDDATVEIFIREAVESRRDYSFLSADFKSIELRVLAHFSSDSGLLKVLHESDHHKDVFVSLACYWLHVEADQVTNVEREKTKRVVYAVVYGVGKDKLADILNIHPSHAKELMESFLAQFPGVQQFIQNTIATCRKQGYVTTLMNRRRYFPSISSDNFMGRSHAERQAVNFVIQGSAADICKTAMLKVMETLTQFNDQAKLLLQIHDELLFEIPTKDLHQLADVIHTSLESHKAMLTVPLHVRISASQTWASLQSLN